MRKMAKDMDMSHTTMVKAVKDLGMVSRVRPLRHLLTEQQKEKRLECCKKMLTWMKHHGGTVKIFSDKKTFTVDQAFNRRHDHWVGPVEAEAIPVQCTKLNDLVPLTPEHFLGKTQIRAQGTIQMTENTHDDFDRHFKSFREILRHVMLQFEKRVCTWVTVSRKMEKEN